MKKAGFATCILSGERLLNLSCIEVIHVQCKGVGEDHEYRALLRAIASMYDYEEYTACL